MKKFLISLLAIVMVLTSSACSGLLPADDTSSSTSSSVFEESVEESSSNMDSSMEENNSSENSSDEERSSEEISSENSSVEESSSEESSMEESSVEESSSEESSSEDAVQTVIITFKQKDQPDIEREIEQGGTLTDVPTPAPKTGYKVEWEACNFTNVTQGFVVNAVETAKEYTVILDVNGGVLGGQKQFTVTYGINYSLPQPENEERSFSSWQYEGKNVALSGVWSIDDEDGVVNLTAKWGSRFWTKNY